MIPVQKVKDIISKHTNLEKELSSGNTDSKLFAKKSKEYSDLGDIIEIAKEYINFEGVKKDLEQILKDKDNDSEIIEMAKKDLEDMEQKKQNYENKLKIFLLPKDEGRLTKNWNKPRIDHNFSKEKEYLNLLRKNKKVIDIV